MAVLRRGALTVLGNFSVDRVNDAGPSPGGCPSFAPLALKGSAGGRVVARLAEADRPIFSEVIDETPEMAVLTCEVTSAFGLHYDGETRSMTVDAIGDPWTPEVVGAAAIDTEWVHLAALLRSDFPPETIVSLARAGHRLSYDGQGLVRVSQRGEMRQDADYEPALLDGIAVLKLNDEEADVVAGGTFGAETAKRLGCPEIVVTFGSRGCDVYAGGTVSRVPANPVLDIHSTGAGDVFTTAYVAARALGAEPVPAAERASRIVEKMLERRRAVDL